MAMGNLDGDVCRLGAIHELAHGLSESLGLLDRRRMPALIEEDQF